MQREFCQMSTRLLIALVITLLIAPSLFAQVELNSAIQGTVKDPQGAVVAGATVELTSPAIMAGKLTTTTDSSGYYRFDNLRPGTYTLSVTKSGFATYKIDVGDLAVGRRTNIDPTLKVGAASEVVEVTGQAPLIDISQSKVQTNVTQDVLQDVPKGRSFQSVIQFAPGARSEPLQGGSGGNAPTTNGSVQTLGYQIDGAANSENSYMVEGQETASVRYGTADTNVPMEFTQEIVIKSSGFEAEHGGAMGGIVNVIQKRGSNEWHGSVFTYYSADNFDAAPNLAYKSSRNMYQPVKDHYRLFEPGFEAGGFLWKDKIWAFASFVPRLWRQERTVNMTFVPTGKTDPIGNRTFANNDDIYYSLARVDANPFSKLHVYGTWQYNSEKNQGYSQPGPDDVFGTSNPRGASSNPDNYNNGIGYRQPNVIFGAGGDYTPTPAVVISSRWGRQYVNYKDVGLPVGILYYYRNTSYYPNSISSYDYTIAPANTCVTTSGTAPVPDAECPGSGAFGTTAPGSGVVPLGSMTATTLTPGTGLDVGCPTCVQSSGFTSLGNNLAYLYDKYFRTNFAVDGSYFVKGFGTHNFKVGYLLTQLSNSVNRTYNTAEAFVGYDLAWTPSFLASACGPVQNFNTLMWPNDPRSGTCRGQYGTINFQDFATFGDASSSLHGLYAQDSWNIGHGVTVNVGFRFDKEAVPSYFPGLPSINFDWTQKFAPRLGASWDVLRNGKIKVYGSFGYFYNPMKYDLPRGSFGGDYWHDCVYALDSPNVFTGYIPVRGADGHFCEPTGGLATPSTALNPYGRPNGGLLGNENFRIPSNDPSSDCSALQNDPGSCVASILALNPMKQHEIVLGVDWQIKPMWALQTRWSRKRLDRAIEDTGVIGIYGEQYSINNPGQGINATMYGPVCSGSVSTNCVPLIPQATRAYDGLEFRLTKAASSKWYGEFAYTYSRLYGNYAGGTNTDIADGGGGRQSNTGRAFDEPMGSFDAHGNPIDGPLATDRPHTFKGVAYYRLKWWKMETILGGYQQWYSGSALSTYVDVFGMNTEVEGRGNWVDVTTDASRQNYVLGAVYPRRTPQFSQSDISIVQEFHVSKNNENLKLGFEANIFNIFNQHSPMYYYSRLGGISPYNIDVTQDPGPCLNGGVATSPLPQDCIINYPYLLTGSYNYITELNSLGPSPNPDGANTLSRIYGQAYGWQSPRTMRFKLKFTF